MIDRNDSLDLEEIVRVLRSTPNVLRALLQQLPDRTAGWHPGAGKWCIKAIVGHLTEEDERDFVGRIRVMLDHDEPRLSVNDQDKVARERHDCVKHLEALLDEFSNVRSCSADFVLTLNEADLYRSGVHPKIDRIHVSELLQEWIYHDLNHIKQITSNLQRFLWGSLGNMQAFYEAPKASLKSGGRRRALV